MREERINYISMQLNSCVALTLVWYSFFCYSEGVVGLVDPLDFWVFNSTQSNNFMVKYSTDIYFIPIRSNMNSKYG